MKYDVGVRLGTYRCVPTNPEEQRLLENVGKMEFKAVSVGNNKGQVALFPIDDFGEEAAWKNAQLLCDVLNSQNDR